VPARSNLEWRHRNTTTDGDGKFSITVPPGPGLLLVKAAEPDFVRVETGTQVAEGGKGGTPLFPDAFVPLQLKPGNAPADLTVRVRRGVVFRGGVVSSDGSPVKSGLLFTPKYMPDGIEFNGHHLAVRDGRFELPGCEPGEKVGVWVYDPQKKEGGHAEFVVGVGGDPTLRLSPCTSATVRVADRAGKPIRGAQLTFHLDLRRGDDANDSADTGAPAGLSVPETAIYSWDLQTADTGDGKFPLRELIPGATYTIWARTTSLFSERITFTAPKTGTPDLGTLVPEPPKPPKNFVPPTIAQPYIYEPKAVDPEGDPITFDLVQGPVGMSFDPQTGVLFWLPSPKDVGRHTVVLRASDSYGRTAIQRFQLNIRPIGGG